MFDALLREKLVKYKNSGLYRNRTIIDSSQDVTVKICGQYFLNFSSNNYLGLANHPDVIKSFQNAVNDYGVGSGASHLVTGHSSAHHELEEALAVFTSRPRALLFSCGYMANLGVISALMKKTDAVFEDRLNHASLLDAGLLSGAKFHRYLHCNTENLNNKLSKSNAKNKLIVTDGIFSMDGNMAPLRDIVKFKNSHNNTYLMVDDAHAIGVIGTTGAGSLEYNKLNIDDVPILMGTLGKAFGTMGAFVAGSDSLIETLIQFARTYMFTTAIPPAIAKATLKSLSLIKKETWRRDKLTFLIKKFRKGCSDIGFKLMSSNTPIQPLVIGHAGQAVYFHELLKNKNILVTAIRPPTVPKNTSRLRITLSALHTEKHIDELLNALFYAKNKMRFTNE